MSIIAQDLVRTGEMGGTRKLRGRKGKWDEGSAGALSSVLPYPQVLIYLPCMQTCFLLLCAPG